MPTEPPKQVLVKEWSVVQSGSVCGGNNHVEIRAVGYKEAQRCVPKNAICIPDRPTGHDIGENNSN